jgi:hypothetical protein
MTGERMPKIEPFVVNLINSRSLLCHTIYAYLMHGERLDLSLEDLHPRCRHHGADIGDNSIGEYFINEPMISKITSICHMLHRIAIVLVCNKSLICFNTFQSNAEQELVPTAKEKGENNGTAVTFFILCRLDVYTPICRLPRSSRRPFMGFPVFCSCLS